MTHIMIDIETMSVKSNAAMISIGAVRFNATSVDDNPNATFYCKIDLQSCIKQGLAVDGSTIYWWLKQSKAAREAVCMGTKLPLLTALNDLKAWFPDPQHVDGVWGNGATFDNVIIHNAYKACGLPRLWHYTKDRCFRTIKNCRIGAVSVADVGTAHNALDDAIWQAKYAVELCKSGNISL